MFYPHYRIYLYRKTQLGASYSLRGFQSIGHPILRDSKVLATGWLPELLLEDPKRVLEDIARLMK